MQAVHGFQGGYRFLSNFHHLNEPVMVDIDEWTYSCTTVEHGYQASKATCIEDVKYVSSAMSPGVAKRRGREIVCRGDWDQIKLKVMFDLLVQKFKDPVLADKLMATHPMELVEVNSHGDRYWGTDVRLNGENNLGLLLMQVRDLLLSI